MKRSSQVARLRVVAPEELEVKSALSKRLLRVLDKALAALDSRGIQYVVVGGLAARAYGIRQTTDDIDFLVTPPAAVPAISALAEGGFRTWIEDPSWLHKGIREGVEVDIIYESGGTFHADEETFARAMEMDIDGRVAKVIAIEDFFVTKALVVTPVTPRHWHDAVKVLRLYAMDWEYVVRRARGRPRKVLTALLAGHEAGVAIPSWVFATLMKPYFTDSV